jgi:hypothetical protein
MEHLVIGLVALAASALTLYSGFGLGTLLLPAMAFFFPVDVAVAVTALVHLLNNLFKLVLLGRHADRAVVIRFGLPAIGGAAAGAWLLASLGELPALATHALAGRECRITALKLIIAFLMIVFAVLELRPRGLALQIGRRHLPIGGVLSGFFGGLSGHQGALRSAFLIKAGLTKEAFIATGIVIACLVDAARLAVYAAESSFSAMRGHASILLVAVVAAFAGAFFGSRLLRTMTLRQVQVIVAIMLMLVAVALAMGVV